MLCMELIFPTGGLELQDATTIEYDRHDTGRETPIGFE